MSTVMLRVMLKRIQVTGYVWTKASLSSGEPWNYHTFSFSGHTLLIHFLLGKDKRVVKNITVELLKLTLKIKNTSL